MTPPKYSIIVPTFNRLEELKELLPSLDKQIDAPIFEMVVIDDGSTDSTEEYINRFDSKFQLRYKKQKNKGPGAARNWGMSIANGEYFIFLDSDCIIPQGYLSKVDQHITTYKPDAFGGPDSYHPSFSPLLKAINYSMTSFIGTGGTRGSKNSITKFYPRSFNMGFHRNVFETIGGFNSMRHGQDMDFSARIYKGGFKVDLIENAEVYHKRRTSLGRFFKQIFNWGVARINLAQLHDGLLKPVHLAPAILLFISVIIIVFSLLGLLSMKWLALLLVGISIIGILAFVQSVFMYGEIQIGLLSIITLFIQVLAYGLGSWSGLWQRYVLRRKESKGFVKNYYK